MAWSRRLRVRITDRRARLVARRVTRREQHREDSQPSGVGHVLASALHARLIASNHCAETCSQLIVSERARNGGNTIVDERHVLLPAATTGAWAIIAAVALLRIALPRVVDRST